MEKGEEGKEEMRRNRNGKERDGNERKENGKERKKVREREWGE